MHLELKYDVPVISVVVFRETEIETLKTRATNLHVHGRGRSRASLNRATT